MEPMTLRAEAIKELVEKIIVATRTATASPSDEAEIQLMELKAELFDLLEI